MATLAGGLQALRRRWRNRGPRMGAALWSTRAAPGSASAAPEAAATPADICLVLEGSYPYVAGGVSTWVHDLLLAQRDLRFHLWILSADATPRPAKYELPPNVVGVTHTALQGREAVVGSDAALRTRLAQLRPHLARLLADGRRAHLRDVLDILRAEPRPLERAQLLDSEAAFEMLRRTYTLQVPGTSFLRFFWSWRSLVGGLFAVLFAPLPRATVFHAISTGYAGVAMARAVVEGGACGVLTEHGIYTNERRIEIAMADWLADGDADTLSIDKRAPDLRDFWLAGFSAYASLCYDCCDHVITLYEGNQTLQRRDGAREASLRVIPNGIDIDAFGGAKTQPGVCNDVPTVALIGRVVPIKDVKTFIRAVAMLREDVPGVRALVLGPCDEDETYHAECVELIDNLGLEQTLRFTGRVRVADHFQAIDVVVLTSLSEAQPLVLLEAGAAGIPCVATDVGSCRDIIEGRQDEQPRLGHGGFVTALANPRATASACAQLLSDAALYADCARAIQARTRAHYTKRVADESYARLYRECLDGARLGVQHGAQHEAREPAWPASASNSGA